MKNDPAVMANPEYRKFIEDLKARITDARISAARHVNRDLILLYWDIGRGIVEKQQILGWRESVIDRISADLWAAFPAATGFSSRNLRDMKRFYLAYTDAAIWRQPVAELAPYGKYLQDGASLSGAEIAQFLQRIVAEIPWGHNLLILNKLTDPAARLWYLQATARSGWSRNVLLNQIKAGAYERAKTDKKTHNFDLAPCPSIWPSRPTKCSRAPTTSNSLGSAGHSRKGHWKTGSSNGCGTLFWSSATAFASSAASTG